MLITCGFSQGKITPNPNTIYLDGYGFRLEHAKEVRDDIYVKVLALKDIDDKRFCIVSFDFCGFNDEVSEILKFHISTKSGLDKSQIALTATHTHAGPACGVLEDVPLNLDYIHNVGEIAGDWVNEAFSNMEDCTFTNSFGEDILFAHNRRGKDIIDRSVRVGTFINQESKLKGLIARTSCHPVLMSDLRVSADYPSKLTEEGIKNNACFLFLQGSCGDVNPQVEGNTGDDKVELLGNELSKRVMDVVNNIRVTNQKREVEFKLSFDYKEVEIPMQPFPPKEEVEENILKTVKEYYSSKDGMIKHFVLRKLSWYRMILDKINKGEGSSIKVPLQVLSIKEGADRVIFTFLPFEVLTKTSLMIQDKLERLGLKKENIYVIGHSNSVFGYLIPEEEIEGNNYEYTDAPTWYNTALFSKDSEPYVLGELMKIVEGI